MSQLIIAEDVAPLPQFQKILKVTPSFLSKAEAASLTLIEGKVTLAGMIESEKDAAPLMHGLHGKSQLHVQPHQQVDLKIQRTEGHVILSGLLPNLQTKTEIIQLITESSPDQKVIDESSIAIRPREFWWLGLPPKIIPNFLKTSQGHAFLHFTDQEFHASGSFEKESSLLILSRKIDRLPIRIVRQTELNLIPQDTNLNNSLTGLENTAPEIGVISNEAPPSDPETHALNSQESSPSPPEEDSPLSVKLKLLPIYFNSSSTYLKPSEWPKVDQAAALILSNPEGKLTVGGYADRRGDPDTNKSLARKRADQVRKRLIKKGVPSKRLIIDHFGADPSITEKEDLWKGRRVEIALQPNP